LKCLVKNGSCRLLAVFIDHFMHRRPAKNCADIKIEKGNWHMTKLEWDREFALEQAGDDEEMLAELLSLFRQSSANDMAQIHKAFRGKDGQGVSAAAHSIKGAAASLGFEGVRLRASQLEKAGEAGDFKAAETIISILDTMLDELAAIK